jgi:Na+-translocating ferredoxin:NAD+ oxidoreductase RnfG subunit
MQGKHYAILLIIVAAVSSAVTRYYYPRVEYKTQEVVKEVVRNDIKTIVKEVVKPDGTKTKTTTTTDKSVKKESSTKEVLIFGKSQWFFALTAQKNLKDSELGYELSVAKRQAGPFYLIGQLGYKRNDLSAGIGIGMEY